MENLVYPFISLCLFLLGTNLILLSKGVLKSEAVSNETKKPMFIIGIVTIVGSVLILVWSVSVFFQ